jgi:uncharacterized membrane protein YhaH (DUF805 family)
MDPQAIIEVFRRNLTEHYFDFNGRVGRREFWYYVIAVVVIVVAVGIVGSILGTRLLSELASLALFLPNLGIGARRLHDVDKTAMFLLLPIVPSVLATLFLFILLWPLAALCWLATLAAAVLLIYFYAQPGTSGSNQYGAEPPDTKPAVAA